jgi:hypothetical protein
VNPAERLERQVVRFQLSIHSSDSDLDRSHWIDFRSLVTRISTVGSV